MSLNRLEFVVCAKIEHEPQFHELVLMFKSVPMFTSASYNINLRLYEFKFVSIYENLSNIEEIGRTRLPQIRDWFLKNSNKIKIKCEIDEVKFKVVTEQEALNKFNYGRTGGSSTK